MQDTIRSAPADSQSIRLRCCRARFPRFSNATSHTGNESGTKFVFPRFSRFNEPKLELNGLEARRNPDCNAQEVETGSQIALLVFPASGVVWTVNLVVNFRNRSSICFAEVLSSIQCSQSGEEYRYGSCSFTSSFEDCDNLADRHNRIADRHGGFFNEILVCFCFSQFSKFGYHVRIF